MPGTRRLAVPVAVAATSFLFGSVPFSQLAARRFAGVDLRRVGTGTVSGTALYQVAGFGPLAGAGVLEVLKGAAGPLLARAARAAVPTSCGHGEGDYLGAMAAGAAIAGHDWSPWLRGAGGRGLSPALGAMLVLAPEGAVVLAAAMAAGRLVHQSGAVTVLAVSSLPVLLGVRRGLPGTALGLFVCVPMLVKRVLGNAPLRGRSAVAGPAGKEECGDPGPTVSRGARVLARLVFDRDEPRV